MKKHLCFIMTILVTMCCLMMGCEYEGNATSIDIENTANIASSLAEAQPTPTDIEFIRTI